MGSVLYEKVYRDNHRVFQDSHAQYELYMGEDQNPDLEDSTQPVETSPSLPFTHTPDAAESDGTIDLRCVTRYRNRYGLYSFNQHPTPVRVDDVGDEVSGPLTSPVIESVIDSDLNQIHVTLWYPYGIDLDPADAYEIYVGEGVYPDPETDPSVASGLLSNVGDGDFFWSVTITDSSWSVGGTLNIVAVVYRSDESADSVLGQSEAEVHTLPGTASLDMGDVNVFD